MTPEIEMCCVCRLEQIEIQTDADYVVEFGEYRDRTTIITPGAVDGREFNHDHRGICVVCAACAAQAVAA